MGKVDNTVNERLAFVKPSPHPPNVKRVRQKMKDLGRYQMDSIELLFKKIRHKTKTIKK